MNKTEMRREFDRFMAQNNFCCRTSFGAQSAGDTQWKPEGSTMEMWAVIFKSLTKSKVSVVIHGYKMNDEAQYDFPREENDILFVKILNTMLIHLKWDKYKTMFDNQ